MSARDSIAALPPLPVVDGVEYRHVSDCTGYAVGSDGTVLSCRKRISLGCLGSAIGFVDEWHQVKPWPTGSYGYLAVSLQGIGGERITRKVYRLVLAEFVGPAPSGCVACHNDGDPSNNNIDNLRWDTPKNNHRDKQGHGTQPKGERMYRAQITDVQAALIKQKLRDGVRIKHIAAELGVRRNIIEKIKAGINWRHIP